MRCCCACLACFVHPFGFLYSFTSLSGCLYVHAWVCVSSILQSNGNMDTQSKPTFVLLGHPLMFDNIFICLFICYTCLFASVWHLFQLVFCMLFLPFVSLLVCLLVSFVLACTRMEHGCLEQECDLLGTLKKGKDASKRMQCLIYFPTLCGCIVHYVCMYVCVYTYIYIYTYICLCVYGWLCTLCDKLSWLRERPSLVMKALNLVV